MFPAPVPQCRPAAVLDEGVPDADIEAPPQHAEEPKPSSQTPLKALGGHTGTNGVMGVTTIAFFPDDRRLVGGWQDGLLVIWDITSGEVEKRLTGHASQVRSVAVAPDGSVVASGSDDGTLRLWNGTTGDQVGEPISIAVHSTSPHQGVWGVCFSPDGKRVVATRAGTVGIWDVQTRVLIAGPLQTPGKVSCTAIFSPNGSRIAAHAGDGRVRVWDANSGEVVFDYLEGHSGHVRCTAFTSNGRQLVTATSQDSTIRRWDTQSGEILTIIPTHSVSIVDGALLHGGKTLVIASGDQMVRFWDLQTGNQKSCFLQHERSAFIWCVELSCDGSLLATGGWDEVYLWDMKAVEAEFDDQVHEAEARNEQNGHENAQAHGRMGPGQGQAPPELTPGGNREDDETASTRRSPDMPAVVSGLWGCNSTMITKPGVGKDLGDDVSVHSRHKP
ncbi:WD40 repeat-like protein [Paxillus ammoniavirescens]|nr:WD40 repeat-like protein [Paxillus ammoniavirescens]